MVFREMVPSDIESVSEIAYRAFMEGYYTSIPENDLRVGTYNYVVDDVRDSTFAEVYEENGKVLGFLLGRVDGAEKKFHKSDFLHLSGESRGFSHIGKLISDCNRRLKDSCSVGIDCEGLLFAMGDGERGKGVGTRLMDDMISDFRENGCKCMYLFTGDNCTMDYYEKRDYILVGKEMLDIGNRIRDSRMYIRNL